MHQEIRHNLEDFLKSEDFLKGSGSQVPAGFHAHLGECAECAGRTAVARSAIATVAVAARPSGHRTARRLLCPRHPADRSAASVHLVGISRPKVRIAAGGGFGRAGGAARNVSGDFRAERAGIRLLAGGGSDGYSAGYRSQPFRREASASSNNLKTARGSNSSATRCWWILPVTTSRAMFASDQPTWQNPRILTTLVLVFLTGAMAGAIGMQFGLHRKLHASAAYWRGDKAEFSYDQLKTRAESYAGAVRALEDHSGRFREVPRGSGSAD